MRLEVAHTSALGADAREAARLLLYDVFDDMTEADWEHSLGGMHTLVWDGPELIGHAAVIQRRLLHGSRALRCGYVEGVGIRASHRGRGHGGEMMDVLEGIISGAYDLGALGATDEAIGFYARRHWILWQGPTSALTPAGIEPTPDEDGGIFVFPVSVPLDLTAGLICDWRTGDGW